MTNKDGIWEGDLLGFKAKGDAFTNLVTTITDHRTISIEAGYGRGKTFFRERWAKQLRAEGECVVEIDARLSDHSGDPVVTFLGALLGLVPDEPDEKIKAVLSASKKIAIAGTKAVGKAALREGFDSLAEDLWPEGDDANALQDIAKSAGKDLSKAAGDLIATQLSAERARLELGQQLRILHAQITAKEETDRIIILIDELDRCHPDYAIALLEAMKLVFDQDGFVFVLMVNRKYLESIAAHRFGGKVKGELYLDKFVDLRLKLNAEDGDLAQAIRTIAARLPLAIPFGDHHEFSVERAAALAGELAPISGLAMRQLERVLGRVQLACRIYKDRPIDAPLLVWLSFAESAPTEIAALENVPLPRSELTSAFSQRRLETLTDFTSPDSERRSRRTDVQLKRDYPELTSLTMATFRPPDKKNYLFWALIYQFLAPHYIPEHQAMLDAVHKLQAAD